MELYAWVTINKRFDDIESKLQACLGGIQAIQEEIAKMQQEMQTLIDKVAALKTVEDSAVAMITDFAAQLALLAQNATDLAEMKTDALALADTITSNAQPLADAMAANTK